MELVTSFLIKDARAIRPDLHWRRLGISAPTIWVPPVGSYFPQLRKYQVGENVSLRWILRPAPQLRRQTVLWLAPDNRDFPHLKGPDLPRQAQLRLKALEHGANDAALTSGHNLREAANSALLFIGGDGHELIQAPREEIVESTTVAAAVAAGIIPQPKHRHIPREVALQLPAITASALHGFTPVSGWVVDGNFVRGAAVPLDCAAINRELWDKATALVQ